MQQLTSWLVVPVSGSQHSWAQRCTQSAAHSMRMWTAELALLAHWTLGLWRALEPVWAASWAVGGLLGCWAVPWAAAGLWVVSLAADGWWDWLLACCLGLMGAVLRCARGGTAQLALVLG